MTNWLGLGSQKPSEHIFRIKGGIGGMSVRKMAGVVLVAALLPGCASWVDLTAQGEKVRVLELSEVATCKKLGETTVSLASKVAGMNRSEKQVQEELRRLARNSGAEINGDTVVPMSDAVEGIQKFAVYKCVGVKD